MKLYMLLQIYQYYLRLLFLKNFDVLIEQNFNVINFCNNTVNNLFN